MRQNVYTGDATSCISFPLGGIGSGSIGLAGNGRLIDWEIFNRPSKGSDNGHSHFAVKAEREDGTLLDARVLNGDVYRDLSGALGHGFGSGLTNASMAGFPHFGGCAFTGEFPIARIDFDEQRFPGVPSLTAFNPMIPDNDRDSSIPAAFFELSVKNDTENTLYYTFAATLRNPYGGSVNTFVRGEGFSALHLKTAAHKPDSPEYGDLTLAAGRSEDVSCQEYWYRGSWWDNLETYWRNFTEYPGADVPPRSYDSPGNGDCGTLYVKTRAAAGETASVRFVISWNRPNNYNYWSPMKQKNADGSESHVTWKNYYATLFADSLASARYSLENYDRLWGETDRFRSELFSATLPDVVKEAVSATMSVLKTATVLRLENGEFYGWEGMNESWGSCEGTCTHVWNYAYALAFLYPSLERTIRETDFKYNQDETGRMSFRMTLPLGRRRGGFRACVDGQMGGVIKTYREWKLCGDGDWLRSVWPACKKSLEYAWSPENPDRWDADKDGVLEGRQHHTLDMELFGPSSWLEGFYLAALRAGAEMARYLGEEDDAREYEKLFDAGKKWSDEHLFNGKYYYQRVDLTDRAMLSSYEGAEGYWNAEAGQIKYQIGDGCEIAQLLAQWHANINGLGDIFDPAQRAAALKSLLANNYKERIGDCYNTFRIFAINDEAATVICDYPDGAVKPAIPIPYAQESMHGFEYALAGLLMSEGDIGGGLKVTEAVRARYRGYNRNPWNEIECGSNYARSMASFAQLPILSGFSFDGAKRSLGFSPKVNAEAFRCPWFASDTWGRAELTDKSIKLTVFGKPLPLAELKLPFATEGMTVTVDGAQIEAGTCGCEVRFSERYVREYVEVRR